MLPISTYQFTMFDYFEDVIAEAAEDLKNSHSYYHGNNQLFKVDSDSPSMQPKDAELLYCHIVRLLFTSKRSRPDIQSFVAYLSTTVRSSMDHYKDIHLDIDLLLVNKTQIHLIISWNLRFMYFNELFLKRNKYV